MQIAALLPAMPDCLRSSQALNDEICLPPCPCPNLADVDVISCSEHERERLAYRVTNSPRWLDQRAATDSKPLRNTISGSTVVWTIRVLLPGLGSGVTPDGKKLLFTCPLGKNDTLPPRRVTTVKLALAPAAKSGVLQDTLFGSWKQVNPSGAFNDSAVVAMKQQFLRGIGFARGFAFG